MEVTRAICASISRIEGSVMDQMLAIRNEFCAPERNTRIRAALLYASRWFVLWVEGRDEDVDEALRRAAADPRNQHQKLLHRSRGDAVLHDRIAIATTQAPIRPTQYARHIAENARWLGDIQPADIWQQLAAPSLLDPKHAIGARPAHHVALVSAEDNGPTEQLRKLGDRFRTHVVYQRFVGPRSRTADVGTAYVDIPIAGGVGRIHLVSRKALGHSLARQQLSGLDGLALLLGSQPSAAIGVATAAAEWVHGCEQPPSVYVVGAVEDAVSACVRLLEDRGVGRIELPQLLEGARDVPALLPSFGWQPRGNSVGAPGASHGWA